LCPTWLMVRTKKWRSEESFTCFPNQVGRCKERTFANCQEFWRNGFPDVGWMPPTKVPKTRERRGWKGPGKLRKGRKIDASWLHMWKLKLLSSTPPYPAYSIRGTPKSWLSLNSGRRRLVSRWGCSRSMSWVEWSAKLIYVQRKLTRLPAWCQGVLFGHRRRWLASKRRH